VSNKALYCGMTTSWNHITIHPTIKRTCLPCLSTYSTKATTATPDHAMIPTKLTYDGTYRIRTNIPRPHGHGIPLFDFKARGVGFRRGCDRFYFGRLLKRKRERQMISKSRKRQPLRRTSRERQTEGNLRHPEHLPWRHLGVLPLCLFYEWIKVKEEVYTAQTCLEDKQRNCSRAINNGAVCRSGRLNEN
jgi:hypothetical protein